jgi:4-hydroxy-tetrahydrodipicolinate synthase
MSKFIGTGVAVITPFTTDNRIDYPALERIINHLIENGIDYLVVMGSTAEAATLDKNEKDELRSFFVKITKGRVPLVIGVGGNNTAKVVEEIRTTDFTGYDAVLSVSPSYNKPSQEGIYQHFKEIALVSSLPIILYNVPGRTGKNIEPDTVVRLANDFDNIIGIKEAAGDMIQVLELIQKKPDNFLIISGDDMIALPMTLAGGAGVISVIAQGIPNDFSRMIQLGLQNKAKEAFTLQYKMMDAINLIFEEGNPTGIKSMLHTQSFCENIVRLPLVEASEKLQNKIMTFLKEY